MSKQQTVSRKKVFASPEFAQMKESLMHVAEKNQTWNPLAPIRGMPFEAFFKYKEDHSLEEGVLNPDLGRLFHEKFGVKMGEYAQGYQEAVSIPANLVQLKVADMVLEGAEPYSQWKEYIRVVDMPTPKFNVPIDKYTDWVGNENFELYRAGAGGPIDMGGLSRAVELDTEDDNGYYRAKIGVRRNDIRDNKFLAIEQNLKNSGAAWYYALGKKIIDFYLAQTTHTATRVSLQLPSTAHSELEAIFNVIRKQFPGFQRNRADTMFMSPQNAFETAGRASSGGFYPFLDNRLLKTGDEDVINNSGMAKAFGLKRVFETPQLDASGGKVIIVKRDIAAIFGLYQDLEIEDFDMDVAGLTESALSMRIDLKPAHNDGQYIITSFNAA